MTLRAHDHLWGLTEKEKQTLRLMVRGHDAKSIARSLGLSVHTINERLRDARRKMAVSSSREAARLLLEAEDGSAALPHPDSYADTVIGEAAHGREEDAGQAPSRGVGRVFRAPRILIGAMLMTFALAALALSMLPLAPPAPPVAAVRPTADPQVAEAALRFLELVDAGRWEESYRQTGTAFRKLNSQQLWADTSEKVRVPLGAVVSRRFADQQSLPAPPNGYEVVRFHTRFAHKPDAIETVSLEQEDGVWRVVGVIIT